jgi:uncharacterized membrane protein HdeD (DUF308 family)
VRAILAAGFGLAVFGWTGITIESFVHLFGFYAVFDGMVALAIAIDVKDRRGFGSLLFEALVRIGGGLVALGDAGLLLTFPRFFAAWAIVTGIADATVAVALRREFTGEWPLPFASAVSVTVALLLLLSRVQVGVPALRWLVGPYAIVFGVTLLVLARRLHQLAIEIQGSATASPMPSARRR